jgi:outer membrane biogenesis lipoprotein LolB
VIDLTSVRSDEYYRDASQASASILRIFQEWSADGALATQVTEGKRRVEWEQSPKNVRIAAGNI